MDHVVDQYTAADWLAKLDKRNSGVAPSESRLVNFDPFHIG